MSNRVASVVLCSMLAGSVAAEVVVRDTIVTNTWRSKPAWGVVANNDALQDWPAITFPGNGQPVSRFGLIAMFSDGSGSFNPPWLKAGDFAIEIGFFANFADWNANPTRLTASFGQPGNAGWRTPIATYDGINYHYLEFNLRPTAMQTTSGITNLISVTFNGNVINPGVLGYLQGGLDGVTDYLFRFPPPTQFKGLLSGFYSQYGHPFTNVAAIVWLESPPCPADLNADTVVDDADFVVFAAAYNVLLCSDPAMPANCPADLNNDDVVDDADFVLFAVAYNELLCP